ncbi:MAG: DMP19 family protein [Paludibacteraceae bacterium]|nr:DMP19 family protein [Paludibacteraceae bacterium]
MDIVVKESDLIKASEEGVDEFLKVFVDKYKSTVGTEVSAGTMSELNAYQHTLLAYDLFREQINEGGFVQLIQNGYGGYIFHNPFAKSLKMFGATKLGKLIYAAKEIYDQHKDELEKETTEEEFYSMYVDFEVFDELEEQFFEIEEESTTIIATYVDEHIDLFATVDKGNG